ncbi:MAG: ADP-ribosylglycohydrolase family protein [Candidatus Sumerlaeota bacterium]
MAGYETLKNLLRYEVIQRAEEGCAIKHQYWLERLRRLDEDDRDGLEQLERDLETFAPEENFPYVENSRLEAIEAVRPNGVRETRARPNEREYFKKAHGGWLGRCVGVMLGRPFDTEPFTCHSQHLQRKDIQVWLEEADAWPLASYVPGASAAEKWQLKLTHTDSTRGKIKRVEADPRLDATFIALKNMESTGGKARSAGIALSWLRDQAYERTPPDQAQAMLNMLASDVFARRERSVERIESKCDWDAIACHRNPFREWNGALRRVDTYGLLHAGQPEAAARAAWADARISNSKNGVYGAMFLSVIIAAAFVEDDFESLIDCALCEIPTHSRLARDVKRMSAWCASEKSWVRIWDRMMEEYGDYAPSHSILTTLCIVMALLRGNGDFSKSLSIAVCCGLDPVTQGGAVGAIMGVLRGSSDMPARWTDPLQNTVLSNVQGCLENRISECASRTVEVWKRMD